MIFIQFITDLQASAILNKIASSATHSRTRPSRPSAGPAAGRRWPRWRTTSAPRRRPQAGPAGRRRPTLRGAGHDRSGAGRAAQAGPSTRRAQAGDHRPTQCWQVHNTFVNRPSYFLEINPQDIGTIYLSYVFSKKDPV